MLDYKLFGIVNGSMAMIPVLLALYSTNASKRSIMGALLAIVLSDPLGDGYAHYVATDELKLSAEMFSTNLIMQLSLLIIVMVSPSIKKAVRYATAFAATTLVAYNIYTGTPFVKMMFEYIMMASIILFLFMVDRFLND